MNSGSTTGSGKGPWDFSTNHRGWYTYDGKVVIATATPYLLNHGWGQVDGIEYHNYYDTLSFTYDGETFEAIVLDSCGACMSRRIIDVFVAGSSYSAYGYIDLN